MSEAAKDRIELSPEQVRDFLLTQPQFLRDHPELLEALSIPHKTKGASLIEYQVSVLQDKNRSLKQQLQHYHQVAADNENLMSRLHDFHLALIRSNELADLLQVLQRLRLDFGCNGVVVAVFSEIEPSDPSLVQVDPAIFAEWLASPQPLCGRLQRDKLEALFGDAAAEVRSAAIAPLDLRAEMGLLALCSGDEHKFHPGMGTLFLTILGQLLGQCLQQHLDAQADQSGSG